MKKIELKKLESIPIELIEISEENVRKTKAREGLEELKQSIKKLGLIHPIIVVKKNGKYELIVGQRRFLACKELGMKEIPAIILGELDSLTKRFISFSENIQRRKLPFEDTIRVCEYLYENYKGTPKERIEKIAKDLGITFDTVKRYLAYRLVPEEVRKMVDEGKLYRTTAYRITQAFWPNKEKIIKIAKHIVRMTKPEWEKVLMVGSKKPEEPIEKIIEEARKLTSFKKITLVISKDTLEIIEKIKEKRNLKDMDTSEFIRMLLEEKLKDEGWLK